MYYILLGNDEGYTMYQEVERGFVQRYCDMDGNTLLDPILTCRVIDANPPQPIWALPDTPVIQPPPSRIVTKLEFRNRFTVDEKIALYSAAETNVLLRIWLDDLSSAEYVDLDTPAVIQGVDTLVSMSIISETRKSEILG